MALHFLHAVVVGVDAAAAAVVVVVANGLVELEGAGRMATWFIDHFAL